MHGHRWIAIVGVCAMTSMTAISAVSRPAMGTPRAVTPDVAATALHPAVRLSQPPRTFTVAAVGDLLPESSVVAAAAEAGASSGRRYEPAALFTAIAPLVKWADLAICHAETPIGRPGDNPGVYGHSSIGGFLLIGPYELAEGIKETGFDRCSTASNHSNDFGLDGVVSTLDALDAQGLGHSGTSRTPAEAGPRVFTVNGVLVSHLAYTRFSNTGWPGDEWMLDTAKTMARVVNDVRTARALGAEVVIVSMHIAHELLNAPLPGDRAFIESLTAATKIDLVIESGPHVVQPVEMVNGTVVYWSVGNLVSGMGVPGRARYSDPRLLDGLMATVRFTEVSPGEFVVTTVPVTVCTDPVSKHVYAPAISVDDITLSFTLRGGLAACLARTQQVVGTAV